MIKYHKTLCAGCLRVVSLFSINELKNQSSTTCSRGLQTSRWTTPNLLLLASTGTSGGATRKEGYSKLNNAQLQCVSIIRKMASGNSCSHRANGGPGGNGYTINGWAALQNACFVLTKITCVSQSTSSEPTPLSRI